MFDWFATYLDILESEAPDRWEHTDIGPGVASGELDALESDLGVRLPDSYRAFVRRWNGVDVMGGPTISGLDFVREKAIDEQLFRPDAPPDETAASSPSTYMYMPAYFLPFTTLPFGSDAFCFDTRDGDDTEYPVRYYDPETFGMDDAPDLVVADDAPNFRSWLFHQTYQKELDDPEFRCEAALEPIRTALDRLDAPYPTEPRGIDTWNAPDIPPHPDH